MSERVNKVWGWEEVIVNTELYCGKILHLDGGARSSLHYHKLKTETFYVLDGTVTLELHYPGHQKHALKLTQGESVTIRPLEQHRFEADQQARIIEFSTPHSDEDVYRLEPSQGSQKAMGATFPEIE